MTEVKEDIATETLKPVLIAITPCGKIFDTVTRTIGHRKTQADHRIGESDLEVFSASVSGRIRVESSDASFGWPEVDNALTAREEHRFSLKPTPPCKIISAIIMMRGEASGQGLTGHTGTPEGRGKVDGSLEINVFGLAKDAKKAWVAPKPVESEESETKKKDTATDNTLEGKFGGEKGGLGGEAKTTEGESTEVHKKKTVETASPPDPISLLPQTLIIDLDSAGIAVPREKGIPIIQTVVSLSASDTTPPDDPDGYQKQVAGSAIAGAFKEWGPSMDVDVKCKVSHIEGYITCDCSGTLSTYAFVPEDLAINSDPAKEKVHWDPVTLPPSLKPPSEPAKPGEEHLTPGKGPEEHKTTPTNEPKKVPLQQDAPKSTSPKESVGEGGPGTTSPQTPSKGSSDTGEPPSSTPRPTTPVIPPKKPSSSKFRIPSYLIVAIVAILLIAGFGLYLASHSNTTSQSTSFQQSSSITETIATTSSLQATTSNSIAESSSSLSETFSSISSSGIINATSQSSSSLVSSSTPTENTTSSSETAASSSISDIVATVQVGDGPIGVAYGNGVLYVANQLSDNVSVINGTNDNLIATIEVGQGPMAAAYSNLTGYVYVADQYSNSVSVINSATDLVIANISVSGTPTAIVACSDGYVYVADYDSNSVTKISQESNTVVGMVTVGSEPDAIAFDSGNGNILIANYNSSDVSIINSTFQVSATVTVGTSPTGISFDPINGYAYVSNFGSNSISVINSNSDTIVTTINISQGPNAITWSGNSTNLILVTLHSPSSVVEIDPTTLKIITTVPAPANPLDIVYDAINNNAYITNSGSNYLTEIKIG